MDETTQRAVQTAYQLLKAGKKEAAFSLLAPVIKADPNAADAWYLLGFAIDDPQKRLYAFQQVLRIDPNNQAAQKQIEKLRQAQSAPPVQPPEPVPVQVVAPAPVSDQPKAPAVEKKKAPKRQSNSIWLVAVGGMACLCVAVVGVMYAISSGTLGAVPGLKTLASPTPFPTATVVRITPTPSPDPNVYTPVFRSTACPFDVPLGTRVKCGVVKVPQDRDKNTTDLIEIPVVVYQSPKPDADVLFYLQGGPGVESIDWSLGMFEGFVTPFLEEYDMVFFDPRGTGRSEPRLDCPQLNEIYISSYFQSRTDEEAFKLFTEAWTRCHQQFVDDGIDPGAFNSTQSAADVRDIAVALGFEKVNLIGISYGTRLAQTIMRDYPDLVRAVVIDSVVPMETSMFSTRAHDVQYAMDKMFTDCANSARCNAAYPDLRNKFNALIERFDKNPVKIKIQDPSTGFVLDIPVDGVDMVGAVVAGMHVSQLVPVIPKAIYDIEKGDYTFLSFALGASGGDYNSLSMGTYFATTCHEQAYITTPQEMDAALNAPPIIKEFSLASIFGSTERLFQLCDAWGAHAYNPINRDPIKVDVPTLVIAGKYDPTTPVTTGEIVSASLPNDYFYVIPGMGHGATAGNECALKITMNFLRDPAQEPLHDCLEKEAAFEFFLPYDGQPVAFVPITELNLGLRGIVPPGWKKINIDPAYYRRAYLFDPTMVSFTTALASKEYTFQIISSSFESSGFDEPAKKIGSRQVNDLNWTIYGTKFNGEPVFLAIAESGYRSLVLVMVVSGPEKEASYNGLFLPMVDGLVPQ